MRRRSMCRLSKIDVSPFEDRCHDVSTFGDRCVDFRRSMCRPSEMDVLTFEDRWPMCRPSKIGDWCVDLRRSIVDVSTFEHVKLGCYTCSKYWYYSCMRITPRVCTSVLSLTLGAHRTARVIVVVVCVWVCVCVCVCVYVWPLITAASHIGITKQRYQRAHSNTAIVLNFADFPKNASFKRYGVICLPRAAPAS